MEREPGEALFSELRRRSEAEVAQVLADARTEADRIRAGAEARRAQQEELATLACDAALAPRRGDELREARRVGERVLLEARHALIERAVGALRELAATAEPPAREAIADRLAALLAYAVEGQPVEVRARPDIAAVLSTMAPATGARVLADAALSAGMTLVSLDGSLVVEDTVDAWLSANAAQVAIDVCRLVEGPEGTA